MLFHDLKTQYMNNIFINIIFIIIWRFENGVFKSKSSSVQWMLSIFFCNQEGIMEKAVGGIFMQSL